jgi:hypothetical protein
MVSGINGHTERLEEMAMVIPELIPGTNRVLMIFHSPEMDAIRVWDITYDQDPPSIENLDPTGFIEMIQKQRREAPPFDWIMEDELPFNSKAAPRGQIDIFMASRNQVLRLAQPNPSDGRSDLIFVHLGGWEKGEKVHGIRRALDSYAREYIGQMAFQSFRLFMGRTRSTDDHRERFMQRTRESFRIFLREREQNRRTALRYQDSLLRLAEARLKELGQQYTTGFHFNESAKEAIRNYPGDIAQLLQRIDKAAEYALELYRGSQEPELGIEDWFLETVTGNEPGEKVIEHQEVNVKGALTRTIELLDKLEDAARRADQSSQKLTSVNVGRLCPTPISAPAITDSIRNHKDRILVLLQKHPERWSLIRNRFRPITNLVERSFIYQEKESA